MNIRKTRAYITWKAMNTRCNNPNNPKYHRYGGRGIKICERWQSFELFFEDMGEREVHETIDRKNNDLGYSKGNCRWASVGVQNRNRKWSIIYRGENATDASIRLGGNRSLVASRLKLGWTLGDAFSIRARVIDRYENKSNILITTLDSLI